MIRHHNRVHIQVHIDGKDDFIQSLVLGTIIRTVSSTDNRRPSLYAACRPEIETSSGNSLIIYSSFLD